MKRTIAQQAGISTTFREASKEVAMLQRYLEERPFATADVEQAEAALEALPLTSDEFSQAVNRLRNAYRYACALETGASQFELQLLASALKQLRRRYT